MSENTQVTIDTISYASGLADPYFTIKNPTVNYGSVGTYSTQDCGKVYTDELFTGWENPFLIEVSKDCPNDYRFTLNIKITCENALDEEDDTLYVFGEQPYPITLNENVRSGYILPSIIDKDMVLTKNNLYIIPNATIITEGTTVRVEPGTHIQFWSDDANDPYADSYIAYLLVNGNFLVEGTKEEPVYIYPSQLMDHYGVEIGSSSKGYVSLKYADITNFMYYTSHTGTGNHIDLADHCTFRNNYSNYLYHRYLNEGVVRSTNDSNAYIGNITAKDCVFYKLTLYSDLALNGKFDRCIFTQCGIDFDGNLYSTIYGGSQLTNCVFLGNALRTASGSYYNSSLNAGTLKPSVYGTYYFPETGTTYIRMADANGLGRQFLAETLGMENVPYVVIETPEEGEKLAQAMFSGPSSRCIDAGIYYDAVAGKYLWSDGSAVDSWLDPSGLMKMGNRKLYLYVQKTYKLDANGNYVYENGHYAYVYTCRLTTSYGETLYEIPGPILPTNITFNEYTVDLDLEASYQLAPMNTPVQIPADQFLYESADETVITVSKTGLVTPVGKGTADVWVYSADKAVKNRVTFTIRDYVALEKLAFPVKTLKLEMGKPVYAPCVLTPADTTRRNVTYTTSDPTVVAVDNGLLTAVGKGTATVTATCEGLTATLQVTTWVRATSLGYKKHQHDRTLESCDTSLPELTISPASADVDLEWTSDNRSILDVENGKLVLKKAGSTYLRVVDKNSGLKTSFYFNLTSTAPQIQKDMIAGQPGAEPVTLPEVKLAEGTEATPVWKILDPTVATIQDGKILFKGEGLTTLRVTDPRSGLTDSISVIVSAEALPKVKDIQVDSDYGEYVYALLEDGRLYYWNTQSSTISAPKLICTDVKAFAVELSYATVLLKDNTIQKWYQDALWATYTQLQDIFLKDVAGNYSTSGSQYYATYALAEDGTVYARGDNDYGQLGIGTIGDNSTFTQVLLDVPVKQVAYDSDRHTAYYLTETGDLYISGGSSLQMTVPVLIARNVSWLDNGGWYFVTNDHLAYFNGTEPVICEASLAGYTMLDMRMYNNNSNYFDAIAMKDGKLYEVRYDGTQNAYSELTLHSGAIATGAIASLYDYSSSDSVYYGITEDGDLFVSGDGYYNGSNRNSFLGLTAASYLDAEDALYLPISYPVGDLTLLETNLDEEGVLHQADLALQLNKDLLKGGATIYENGTAMIAHTEIKENVLYVTPSVGFTEGAAYKVVVTTSNISGTGAAKLTEDIVIEFTYKAPVVELPEGTTPEETPDEEILPDIARPEDAVSYEAIMDETILRYWTDSHYEDALAQWQEEYHLNGYFYGNAILNPISTDFTVSHWLRPLAPTVSAGEYREVPLGGNYWGSVNQRAIELQMIDYTDFINYARLMYAPYLTEAPENTFPFVTSVTLWNKDGEQVTVVGNEEITFRVTFNRDMDTSIPLLVRFGSAYPYGDYEIEGRYVDARTWEGTYTLKTTIENGYQYFTISNGCSATDDLELQLDQYRFFFEIDTTAAQALIMQGNATDTGIELKWTQDDFDTLMGYNVYRSTKEDGQYQRVNTTTIPADVMTFFDTTIEPGVVYYYNFTVVKTDLTESEPSGKIVIMSKDTMAPNIYHSPVSGAFTGSNLVVSATITDNLNIAYANLYYRVTGTEEWFTVRMNKLNDKYSAIIPAQYLTIEGIEYYIEAFDGVSFTYKGSEEAPYTIAVQEAIDASALGDVDGDGVITNLDALLLLYTINDKYNMTAEEFARADLNGDGELWAAEALRILQYVSGVVGSVKM